MRAVEVEREERLSRNNYWSREQAIDAEKFNIEWY
jgi:hypothetical protein